MNTETERLTDPAWKKWGPYLSERQWSTVREDYSADGQPWTYTSHDMARSKAWRWGEEGLGGIGDINLQLCLAVSLWNTRDEILKERLFGLGGLDGNHGEDVKELYYYLDATPTHSYLKMLYKYPQQAFPYQELLTENQRRSRKDPEYEIQDTGIFGENRYFDVFIEYAKASPEDVLMKITVFNRGAEPAPIHVLPTLWFRNTWAWGYPNGNQKPWLDLQPSRMAIAIHHQSLGNLLLYAEPPDEWLFCDNETNTQKLYNAPTDHSFYKDGINDHIVRGEPSVNPANSGTRAAVHYKRMVEPGRSEVFRLRLSHSSLQQPFADFEKIFSDRIAEADAFYQSLQRPVPGEELKMIHRQALAGMIWNKQYYYYNVKKWLTGDPAGPVPPASRWQGRNHQWVHLNNSDIISMPDTWEYPWFASWDLAFHCICFARLDLSFAKQQLILLTHEWYMHPNGQLPAYEWSFSDVNPPVHAWATWKVYEMEKAGTGRGDTQFLETVFLKLLLNFTWWVNRKDAEGNNIFEGGFLGMDNIGVFDRNTVLTDGSLLEQSDSTSWMCMYSLNMMRIALELARTNPIYQDMATKFFEHFLYIANAMAGMGKNNTDLWDEADEFFYDVLKRPGYPPEKLRIRSMVGLIPLLVVEVIEDEVLNTQTVFAERLRWFLANQPQMASLVSRWGEKGKDEKHLLSLLRGHRMKRLLYRMLDENEFLSDHGIRALSKYHEEHPYVLQIDGSELSIRYTPGESDTPVFGGNSNWRGPVWMPANYLIIESLKRFHDYYGDDFKVEYPTHSGNYFTLKEIAARLAGRIVSLFTRDQQGNRPIYGDNALFQSDPNFRDYILFFEYFHGDTGLGLGASHQTGWTALVSLLLQEQ
jgi:hypothetical protein